MTTVTGKGRPKGFQLIPEGNQVLHITNVVGKPRANVKLVEMDMHNVDGISLTGKRKQSYNLDNEGGYAAFYWLVKGLFDIDLDDGDQFDIDQLEGAYGVFEIVHKKVEKNDGSGDFLTFSNIKSTVGPADGFDGAPVAAAAASSGEDWG